MGSKKPRSVADRTQSPAGAAPDVAARAELGTGAPRPEIVGALGRAEVRVFGAQASLWVAWTAQGLVRVHWSLDSTPALPSDLQNLPDDQLPAQYADAFAAYFAGEPIDPVQLRVQLQGTAFQQRVWQALRAIPRGSVRSYAGIAADVGRPRGMRAVGMANAHNLLAIVVPCHRIVAKDMGLGGYTPSVHLKRFLLDLEGVQVRDEQVSPGQLSLI